MSKPQDTVDFSDLLGESKPADVKQTASKVDFSDLLDSDIPSPEKIGAEFDEVVQTKIAEKMGEETGIWDKIIQTAKAPFESVIQGGKELLESGVFDPRKQVDLETNPMKAFEGMIDVANAGVQALALPVSVPYVPVKEGIERGLDVNYSDPIKGQSNLGKEITSGIQTVMDFPFDVVKQGSELTKRGMELIGVDPKAISKYMGISPELDKKVNDLLVNVAGLGVLMKLHGKSKSFVKEQVPVPEITKPKSLIAKAKPKNEKGQFVKAEEKIDATKAEEILKPTKEAEIPQEAKPVEITGVEKPTKQAEKRFAQEGIFESPVVAPGESRPRYYGRRNKPIEGTGETKVRGLAKTTEATTIEKGLIDKFENLPEYNVLENKQQMEISSKLIVEDFARAKRIALGEEKAPNDVLPEFIYKGVELEAINKGDIGTLRELATSSKLTTEATVMGQRIQALRNQDPLSPVDAIKNIIKTREDRITGGKDVSIVKDIYRKQIKNQITKNTPKVGEWQSFITSIRC